MRATAKSKAMAPLRDRAVCLFTRRWNAYVNDKLRGKPVPRDLAEMAAEAYIELCRLQPRLREKEEQLLPEALKGLDLQQLERLWPFGSALWKEVHEHCRAATGEEGEQAQKLFR